MREDRIRGNDLIEALKIVAPGTPLREGLESILRAKTGALIVIGDTTEVLALADGGFAINKEYSPSHLYELAKMDGAIILSRDARQILFANTQLITDPTIPTSETGIRHRTAERAARQTGELVISISQRRNVITLYKDQIRYILKDSDKIMSKANQALQTLEKYKTVLDEAMKNLSVAEFEDIVTLYDVALAIQRTEKVMRIVSEIDKYLYELGNEGRLVSMQLDELINHTEEDSRLVLQDYHIPSESRSVENIQKHIRSLSQEDLMDLTVICRALGYPSSTGVLDTFAYPKGYRLLNKVPRVPLSIISNVVCRFDNLQGILRASIEQLDEVEGIGEVRARTVKETLRRMHDQLVMESYTH